MTDCWAIVAERFKAGLSFVGSMRNRIAANPFPCSGTIA